MLNRNSYENKILSSIRTIPDNYLPEISNLFESICDKIVADLKEKKKNETSTGFCGCWQDDKSADEILNVIIGSRISSNREEVAL